MLVHFLALAANVVQGQQPTISNMVVTPSAGACGNHDMPPSLTGGYVATPASVRFAWTVVTPNDGAYETQISVNGGTPVAQPTTTTSFTATLAGEVENDSFGSSLITTSVEVRVVRKRDAVIVQTLTGSYTGSYGVCA